MAQLAGLIYYRPTKQQIDDFRVIVPHLITVATEMIDNGKDDDLSGYFVSLGYFYEGQTVYGETERWLKEGVKVFQRRLGEENSAL